MRCGKGGRECKFFRGMAKVVRKKSDFVRIFFVLGVDELRFMRYNNGIVGLWATRLHCC